MLKVSTTTKYYYMGQCGKTTVTCPKCNHSDWFYTLPPEKCGKCDYSWGKLLIFEKIDVRKEFFKKGCV